jgi:phenylalanyl-tRNA synthetase beta chain
MKFTLSWLKDHLETSATAAEIAERLTAIGLEVESLDDKAALQPFVIARVLTAEKHPNADKLRVLMVDAGPGVNKGEPVQVVCGAPNARAGLIGAFAAPGTYVPGIDTTLAVGSIRGVESRGMMCSERELQMSDEHNGIIELAADAPVGRSFASYAGLDDPVFEVKLTPNQPDRTGISGIARDLAASGLGTLRTPAAPAITGKGACPVKVTIEDADLCPGFALRLVRGVRNGPSPKWMQQRLIAIGLRPINALVDITNYLTFDRGRPLHVFDAGKVAGNLVVRRAKAGETVLALDGREYTLTPDNCVIADDNGVESIAGVMGGEHSGCDEATTDVLIESALWNPLNIARTGRSLGIITDARYRFERGVDPRMMVPGLDIATQLVVDLCGGTPSEAVVEGYQETPLAEIEHHAPEVKRLTGIDVPEAEQLAILARLGFEAEKRGAKTILKVPSWRTDVDWQGSPRADIVEEVMRINGMNAIAPVPLPRDADVGGRILTPLQIRTRAARRALAVRGMLECVTYSFIPQAHAEAFGGGGKALVLENPIASDMSTMRPSLLPGLIAAAGRNARRGRGDVALFEVSGIYEGDTPQGQRRVAGGIRRGTAIMTGEGRDWRGTAASISVYDAKADAIAALEAAGAPVANLQVGTDAPSWYHPGRSGTLKLGPKVLGHFGEMHPLTLETLDVKGPLAGFEVWLDALPDAKAKPTKARAKLDLSAFLPVKRDFAFVVDAGTQAALIIRAAKGADKKLVSDVTVFDVFTGGQLAAEGRKSVAIEVTLQPADATLTDEQLDAASKAVIAAVEKATGGRLRA